MERVMRYLLPRSAVFGYGLALVAVAALLLFTWPGLIDNLFATTFGERSFMTHYHCYLEIPSLVRLHLSTDILIGFSYVAISFTLAYLVYRARRDIPFHWVFLAFGLFIIACGCTHFMEVLTTFKATYWLSGYVKLVTAVASVATAAVLPPLVPRTLSMVRAAKRSEEHRQRSESLQFLTEAHDMLASSLDYETTLSNVAQLAVPRLGDWCVIHTVGDDGRLHLLAAEHVDETKLEMLRDMNRRYPEGLDAAHGYPLVLRTGRPELIREITDAMLREVARDAGHLETLRRLGLKSTLSVPLVARGRTLGAISFATAESGRVYGPADLASAEELARRAATAVDNARLYREVQAANRTKDEFLATLSHELRAPLTPIVGWVHMARSGMLEGEEMDRALDIVEKNSQSLTRLINDLLDMSAIMSGKMLIEEQPVPLNAVLSEAAETVRPSAEKRGISLEVKLCDGPPVIIKGDRTRLVQSFWNIMANAVKFSESGGGVRVRCEADAEEALVVVEDEGHGIPAEFLPFVFERFRQADSSKTRLHGGLGIGLALVKSFVEAHGGRVTAESDGPGRGSRFTVRLPRVKSEAWEAGAAPAGLSEEEAGAPGGPLKVLVVEDAPDTLEMLYEALKGRGYSMKLCESARAALEAASSERFDVLISDIGMPEIDGCELLKRLRRLPHMSDLPAIALSGYAAQKDVDAALEAGFDVYVAKPVTPAKLVAEIEQLLGRDGH